MDWARTGGLIEMDGGTLDCTMPKAEFSRAENKDDMPPVKLQVSVARQPVAFAQAERLLEIYAQTTEIMHNGQALQFLFSFFSFASKNCHKLFIYS